MIHKKKYFPKISNNLTTGHRGGPSPGAPRMLSPGRRRVPPSTCYRAPDVMLPWYRGDVTVVRGGCYRAPGGVLPRAPGRPSPGKASRAPPMMSPHHSRSPSITEATCRAYMRSLPSMHDHGRKKT